MDKKKENIYEEPVMEIIEFECEDVIGDSDITTGGEPF